MSFEDDMIEEGFNNEMDYLEYLMDEADERSERMSPGSEYDEPEYQSAPIDRDRIIICRGNKKGVINTAHKTVIKCIFDDIEADGSYFTCYLNFDNGGEPLQCYFNREGRLYELVDNVEYSCNKKYDYGIQKWSDHMNYYLVSLNNKYGCVFWNEENLTFKELVPCAYDQIEIVEDSRTGLVTFIKICINGRWGLYHIKKHDILKARYNIIQVNNGYINAQVNGSFDILDFSYTKLRQDFSEVPLIFSEHLAPFKRNGKYGYINDGLQEVVPAIYDDVTPFVTGIAKVGISHKYGIIDSHGSVIVNLIYDEIKYNQLLFRNTVNFIRAKKNGCWGLLDRNGKTIVNFNYKKIDINFIEDYYAADDALISSDGKLLVPAHGVNHKVDKDCTFSLDPNEYMWVSAFFPISNGRILNCRGLKENDQLALVKSWMGKMGAINRTGDFIIPCKYDSLKACDIYNSGIIIGQLNDTYGCINTYGEIIIPFDTNDITYLTGNVNPLSINGLRVHNFCSKGVRIGDNVYNDLTGCQPSGFERVYNVRKNGTWGAIKADGSQLADFKYDEIREARFGLAAVRFGGKWGFINEAYTEVVPPQYDAVSDFQSLKIIDNDYDYAIKEGNWTVSPNIGFVSNEFNGTRYESDEFLENYDIALENGDKGEIEYWSQKLENDIDNWGLVNVCTKEYEAYLEQLRPRQEKAMAVAIVSIKGKEGVINRCGEMLVDCLYYSISICQHGNSIFKVLLYHAPTLFKNEYFYLTYNGKCGTYTKCFPKKYHAVIESKLNSVYYGVIDNKVGLVDESGKSIIPCRYKQIQVYKNKKVVLFTSKSKREIKLK